MIDYSYCNTHKQNKTDRAARCIRGLDSRAAPLGATFALLGAGGSKSIQAGCKGESGGEADADISGWAALINKKFKGPISRADHERNAAGLLAGHEDGRRGSGRQ